MPEDKSSENSSKSDDGVGNPETIPKPNMDAIDIIAEGMEKMFFEESEKMKLSPYEMNMILARVVLLFDEYKLMHFLSRVGQMEQPNVDFKGSHHIYK